MNEQLFKAFFEWSPTAYSCQKVIFDDKGLPIDYEFSAYNQAYEDMMMLNNIDFLNKRYYDVFPTGWEGETDWMSTVEDAVINQKSIHFDMHRYSIQKWIRIVVFPLLQDTFGCIYYDVTKEYLQDSEIEGFLKVNIDMLCVADTDGNFLKVNKAFEKVLGYKIEDLEGKNFESLIHIEDVPATLEVMKTLKNQESITSFVNRVRSKEGLYRYLEWHSQPNGKYIYASARDITQTRKQEIKLFKNNESLMKLTKVLEEKNKVLHTLAITDELTGLYNRHFLEQRIEEEMYQSDRDHQVLSLAILDMDHFKHVNDTWGHPIGDEVLKKTADLVNSAIRHSDFLVRLGGEEFVIIMPRSDLNGARIVAEKIRKTIGDYEYPTVGHVTASFGVIERSEGESYYSCYKRADKALYSAKEKGRNCVVCSNSQERLPKEMVQILWKCEWMSQNKEIDDQHQELIEEANKLMYMSLSEATLEEKMYQLDIVLNHIKTHFHDEEKIIKKIGYPDYEKHAEIHKHLLEKALRLKKAYLNGEIQPSALFSFIVDDVIMSHTLNTDKEFFEYTKS